MMETTFPQGHSDARDALRLLVLLRHFGWPSEALEADDAVCLLEGETQVQALDHLLCDPNDLACVLIDRVREDGRVYAERLSLVVRQLLGRDHRSRPVGGARDLPLHPPRPRRWQRLDARLAYLSCRSLVQVRISGNASGVRSRYLLTRRGDRLLENSRGGVLSELDVRCRALRSALVDWPEVDLSALLVDVNQRFQTLCQEEQIDAEDDLAEFLFPATFGEPL